MIPPPEMYGHVDSRAELRVAELLSQVDVGEPTTCLYSVRVPVHEYKRMSEVDFLVVWGDTVLVIEVKGGRLGRHGGTWTFTNRFGETNEKREGPFEQAASAMFALQHRLEDRLPDLDVAFGYLVLTPDQELQPDIEWEPQQYAGSRSMSVSGLEQALRRARQFWHQRLGHPVRGQAYKGLLAVLRPDFDRVPSLASRIPGLEDQYVRLAEHQYDLLLVAESNPRIVCTGGAGSGKTLLAVETARRAAHEGATVLLTCRSPGLTILLRNATTGTGVICRAIEELDGLTPVDMLVIDEAQDLMDVESLLKLDELIKGGWRDGRWRIFCDPNSQANVDGVFDRAAFEELTQSASVIDLPYNCRNTSTVVRQTQLVTGADLGVARAGEGPAVEYQRYADQDSAAHLLDARLKKLGKEEIDLREVAVVTMRDTVDLSAATATKAFRSGHLVATTDPTTAEPGKARLVTAVQIKGLETSHVCVVDVEDTRDATALARLYVAMTRPRISLWICATDDAWQQMAQAPNKRIAQ
jgi:hypothetical protein